MPDRAMDQHAEVRRTRGAAVWVGVLAVVAAVAFLVWAGGDGAPEGAVPSTTTSSTTSTLPRRLPVLAVVADTDAGPRPATTADAPDAEADSTPFEVLQAAPIATDGRIVLLVDGGDLLVGRPRGAFEVVDLDGPASAVVASNEPGHVWAVTGGDELALIALDGSDPAVRIPLDGDRVLGSGPFGVVTVRVDRAVSWRRPSFDPAPIPLPADRTAVDAGGEVVLAERSLGADVGRGFELWGVVDGTVVGDFVEPPSDLPAVVAPDGSVVALPGPSGWTVRDARSREELGSLPRAAGEPVWVGAGRFAVLVDGVVSLSDGSTLAPPWRIRALAEQSP